MIDPKVFDDLARRLAQAVPSGIRQVQTDIEKNFHAILQAGFARLDLVTREEFEVQLRLLEDTRSKLDGLQRQLAELQARQPPGSSSQRPNRKKPPARPKT